MKRRHLVLGVAGTATAAGGVWFSVAPSGAPLTIAETLKVLQRMRQSSPDTVGAWSLYQVLVHCAQSVEYSMTGFPEHKPEAFKSTVGSVAFWAFNEKGKMTHGLDEAIPGAPGIERNGDLEAAYARFIKSLSDFQVFSGRLKPHFAYGDLTKQEYEAAHVMHFNNHLQEVLFT